MGEVKQRIEKLYNCEVAVIVPHTDELMTLASSGIFSLRYPDHPVTRLYKQLADRVRA
jgi:septum site-determining protein MinD